MNEYVDVNTLQFYRSAANPPGHVKRVSVIGGGKVRVSVELGPRSDQSGATKFLVVDRCYRYLCHSDSEGETIDFPLARLMNLPPSAPIEVYLWFPSDGVALQLGLDPSLLSDLEEAIRDEQPEPPPEVPSFRKELLDLVIQSTNHQYVSRSNQNSILTGNNYQTLDLGDTLRKGGRAPRLGRISQVDFVGKKVMDIGANTGEVSRQIRRLGARLVDGFEYDKFFVETGRMINAYAGMSRVSLNQADATNPGLYSERYDIVVALSVYVYVKNVLSEIAKITDVMLFETHTLDHGLDFYLNTMVKHFPFVRHLGFTDEDPELVSSRALLLFTTKRALLESEITGDSVIIPPGDTNYYYNDPTRTFAQSGILSEQSLARLRRDGLDTFLEVLDEKFRKMDIENLPDENLEFFSDHYWTFYLLGYADFSRTSVVDTENRFVRYYKAAIDRGVLDPTLRSLLETESLLLRKVRLKFEDLHRARKLGVLTLPPIFIRQAKGEEARFEFRTTGGRFVRGSSLDGHHRLFIAKLCNAESIPFFESERERTGLHSQTLGSSYTLVD